MVVYVEYAFAENFWIDLLLLYLAHKASGAPIGRLRLLVAAALGAAFAILFPLLVLPTALSYLLRFSVGALLCFIAYGRLQTKKEWGRYAFTCVFFFAFTFLFGGALLGVGAENGTWWVVRLGIVLLSAFSIVFIRKLHKKRTENVFLYDCILKNGENCVTTRGFLDSGNAAEYKNIPVCFLSPDLLYDLFGGEIFEQTGGQVCDEMAITTLSGAKKVRLYKGLLGIRKKSGQTAWQTVYFSPTANMLKREYNVLLPNAIVME